MDKINPLVWSDEYSVLVREIDDQHKQLFTIVNELANAVDTTPTREKLDPLIRMIIEYKTKHFATEEKYFREFKYEDSENHIAQHDKFTKDTQEMLEKYKHDSIGLAFDLLDYLEDWLISHLFNYDRKYIKCFQEHGLH